MSSCDFTVRHPVKPDHPCGTPSRWTLTARDGSVRHACDQHRRELAAGLREASGAEPARALDSGCSRCPGGSGKRCKDPRHQCRGCDGLGITSAYQPCAHEPQSAPA